MGEVIGFIIDAGPEDDSCAGVVGFEIATSDALPPQGRRALIPRAQVYAASGEALVVAETATDFIASDLAGFGASVASWRASSHRRS